MDPTIKELSDRMHDLYLEIMKKNPWDPGYGEVVAIHEYLSRVIRDKAQKSLADFTTNLTSAAAEINETWESSESTLKIWSKELEPVFKIIETITGNAVPLLKLIL